MIKMVVLLMSKALTEDEIDESIADSLEHLTGFRPKSWCLYCFDDNLEMA